MSRALSVAKRLLTKKYCRYDIRDTQSLQTLNSMPHSTLMSPTPTSRSVSARLLSTQDPQRARAHGPGYFGHSTYMALSK